MTHIKRFLFIGGIASVMLLSACDRDPGSMMGQSVPVSFQTNGERIYFTGTSSAGRPISFRGGNMHLQMHGGGCVSCHGVERQGGIRIMPWFWIKTPPLTPTALFGDEHGETDGHGDHGVYTAATLRQAITDGLDPAGEALDDTMPHWVMDDQDLTDLIQYLRGPDVQTDDDRHDDAH